MSEKRLNPLYALTRTRILEFVREPEALFWVFAFPILMAVVLGFAFRDRPPDPVPVGVVAGPTEAAISEALTKSGAVRPSADASLAEGLERLRTGKITLLVEEGPYAMLVQGKVQVVTRPNIKGYQYFPLGYAYLHAVSKD